MKVYFILCLDKVKYCSGLNYKLSQLHIFGISFQHKARNGKKQINSYE